jgi:hypothetical protein
VSTTVAINAKQQAREIATVKYVCRIRGCPSKFLDPEESRDFSLWATQVRSHLGGVHGVKLGTHELINDFLLGVYQR